MSEQKKNNNYNNNIITPLKHYITSRNYYTAKLLTAESQKKRIIQRLSNFYSVYTRDYTCTSIDTLYKYIFSLLFRLFNEYKYNTRAHYCFFNCKIVCN